MRGRLVGSDIKWIGNVQLPLFLLPISALVKAELLRTLRLKRSFVLLLLITGGVLIFVAVQAPSFYSRSYSIATLSNFARDIFNFIMIMHLIVAALIIPPMGAMALAGEREKETYDQLSLTLIRVPSLIIGKMLNILGFYALLVLSTLPVVGVIFFYVGVDTLQFIQALGLICVTSLSLCAAGFSVSMSKAESRRIVIRSYAQMFIVFGLPYFIIAFLFYAMSLEDINTTIMRYPQIWCPLLSLDSVLSSAVSLYEYLLMIGYQLFVALCFVLLAMIRLRHRRPSRRRQAKSLNKKSRKKEYHTPLSISDGANPIYCKDVHTARAQNGRVYRIQLSLVFLFSLLINIAVAIKEPGFFIAVYFGWVLLLTLSSVNAISTAMVREWEKNTADLLRGTVLMAQNVFNAKINAELRFIWPMLIASVPGLLIGLFSYLENTDDENFLYLLIGSVYLILGFIYTVFIAIAASVGRNSTSTAVVYAILANVVLQVVLPLMMGLMTGGEGIGLIPCPFLFAMLLIIGAMFESSQVMNYAVLNLFTVIIAIPIVFTMAFSFFKTSFLKSTLPTVVTRDK